MKRLMNGVLIALLALAFSAHAGQVYKWTDAQGRVHYSDRPVTNAQKLDVRVSPASVPSSDAAKAAQRARECQSKRDLLQNYESAARVIERDSLGKEKEFTEDERQLLITRTRTQMEELCAAVPVTADETPAEPVSPAARAAEPAGAGDR